MKNTLRTLVVSILSLIFTAPMQADEQNDLFQLGTAHYARGQYKFAIKRFQKLIEIGTDQKLVANARFFLAESLITTKEYEIAKKHLNLFLENNPEHTYFHQAQYRLGEICHLTQDHLVAEKHLAGFVKNNPKHKLLELALPYLGEIKLKSGDFTGAVSCFQQALKHSPEGKLSNECRFGIAQSLERMGQLRDAERFYQLLIDHPDSERVADSILQIAKIQFRSQRLSDARRSLATFTTRFPRHSLINTVRYWKGRVEFENQSYETAIAEFKRALADQPDKKIVPALQYELARALLKMNRLADALAATSIVVDQYGESDWGDDALLLKIQVLQGAKQFDQALKQCLEFRRSYRDSELKPHVIDSEAACCFALNRYGKTELLLTYLVDHFPPQEQEDDFSNPSNRTKTISEEIYQSWKMRLAISQIQLSKTDSALAVLESIDMNEANQETRSAVLISKASIQIKRNQFNGASENLTEYLQQSNSAKEKTNTLINLALLNAKRQDFQSADNYAQMLKAADSKAELLLELGEIAFQGRNFRYASKWFASASKNSGNAETKSRAMLALVWCQKELGSIESVGVAANRLVQSFPDSPNAAEAIYINAVLLEKADRIAESINQFEILIGNFPRYSKAEKAILALAGLYRKTQSPKLHSLTRPLSQLLASVKLENADQLLYELGWIYFEKENLEPARRCFEKIQSDHPESEFWAESVFRLAVISQKQNQLDTARETLESLVARNPKSQIVAKAQFQLGKISFDNRKFNQAAKQLSRIAKDYPNSNVVPAARFWAAEANYRGGMLETAAGQYQALLQTHEEGLSKFQPTILLRNSQFFIQRNEWKNAIELAEKIRLRYADSEIAFEADYVLGRALAGQGSFTKARVAYTRVLNSKLSKGTETAAMAQWMIGETFFHQEKFEKAIDAYQHTEILHSFPRWQAAALLQAGKCFEKLNQISDAVESYQRILTHYRKTAYVDEASQRVSELQNRTTQLPAQPAIK